MSEQQQITLPRKKHSHRCPVCGHGVYCYKKQCTKPQKCVCVWCRSKLPSSTFTVSANSIGINEGVVENPS